MVGGLKYGSEAIEGMKQLAPLKSATDMADCADAFVMLAKSGLRIGFFGADSLGTVTGAYLTIDAGISLMSQPR